MIDIHCHSNNTALLTSTGRHVVPQEVIDQAEDGHIVESVLLWGRKVGVVSEQQLAEAKARLRF